VKRRSFGKFWKGQEDPIKMFPMGSGFPGGGGFGGPGFGGAGFGMNQTFQENYYAVPVAAANKTDTSVGISHP
jgi:hypothetical protein